jgi:hypothetical protein
MQKLVADSDVDRLCVRASGSHEYARYRKSVADQATPTVHVGSVVQALRRVKRSPSSSGVASIVVGAFWRTMRFGTVRGHILSTT